MCQHPYIIFFPSVDFRAMYGYNSIFSCCHLDSQPVCYNTSSNLGSDQVSRQELLGISFLVRQPIHIGNPYNRRRSTQSVATCPSRITVTPHLLLCRVTKVRALTQSLLWNPVSTKKAEGLLPNENLEKRLPQTFQLYTNSLLKMVLFKLFIAHIKTVI